jgi:hypothetical protein
MDLDRADLLGVDDKGKWLPFAFHLDIVVACKLTTDDDEEVAYGCTTIFTDQNDTYIIDTPYTKFSNLFKEYHTESPSAKPDDINF